VLVSRSARALVAAVLVLFSAMFLFLGGTVQMCLGPLDVTAVQCAKTSGVVPDVGLSPPLSALSISLATFVIAPVPAGRRLRALVAGILGGVIGAAAFLALRPLTMEGFDSTGTWISIPRPVDPFALATAVILAALLGTIIARLLPEGPTREVGSTRSLPQR
jgi:hypothetical protein